MARLINAEYPACENSAPALPAARLTTSRSPRRTMTSVRPGVSFGRSDIAKRWLWPLRRAISIRAASSITGERRSSGPAIKISSSRARCPTSRRGALARSDSRSARSARAAGSECGTRSVRTPSNSSTRSGLKFTAPPRYSSAIRRAASARRLGSPCRTISSSPGISDVAIVIKHTQNRRIGRFWAI